ncbi:MAG: AAA family ATPase [Cocleimonas sp.]|nr:AAA family ATPase [Cocleimonas sp.]
MAVTIPKYAVATNHWATKLYARLSAILSTHYKIYQRLSTDDLPKGVLFCLQRENRSIFFFVCSDESQGRDLSQFSVKEVLAYKAEALQKLLHFQQSLFPEKLQDHADLLAPFIIVFPNSVNADVRLHLKSQGLHIYGRDALIPQKILALVTQYIGMPTSNYVLDYMRCRFSPESIISRGQSLYLPKENSSLKLSHFLLSSEQEYALKQDLVLKTDNMSSHQYNLRLIHGASGSGKSLVLLHRAKLLRELYPNKKVLVLTHNKAINHYLKLHYKDLFENKGSDSECRPFMEWCLRHWKGSRRFVYQDEVMDVVKQVFARHLAGSEVTKNLLLREINFIKDRLIFTEKAYLDVDPAEQAFPLEKEIRERIWRTVLDFDIELTTRNILLWADLPRILWLEVEEGRIQLEQYDHVLIDEAQYFAPIWFALVKKAIKPNIGQLFMVADPDQGFLNRRLSWKETGIDLRNRTFRLKHNYRSNPLILKAADEFLFRRIPNETVNMVPAKPCDESASEDCLSPTLLHFHNEKDERNRLVSEIRNLLQHGVPARDILILEAGHFNVRPLLQDIKKTLDHPVCMLSDPSWNEEALRICELSAATGLESPIVFITGLKSLFSEEQRHGISERERHLLTIENTRKLYMGMTRASEKLILLMTSNTIPKALKIKEIDIPTTSSNKLAPVRYLHLK